ncbi:hypothetical protein A8924_4370 [Saccharopolyspora erythraea NRRL 2338]|uniref:Uncharacterized protein n=1 Tax=Saccharopolyspora erythraea TaxID=1836 RepID=A0ABP3M8C3_SACER|nr:hypothetical protein N599_13915 [Saccharopolyspora erythraea D]PFG96957.1 hypothetical protein A8924_4370 [Saccharopolyspora erythraea NRRL 2338]
MVRLRDWPVNVIPRNSGDVAAAVELLCRRVQWTDANRGVLERLLEPWFAEGWHVQALLHALDHRPDGSAQNRRGKDETADEFVRNRLRYWFDESPQAETAHSKLPPPKPGLEFGRYLALAQERQRREAPRQAARLTERGERARARARGIARSRVDPVQRGREQAERMRTAMDSLLPPGGTAPEPQPVGSPPRRLRDSTRDIADFAARRSLIRSDPRVRRCVQEIADSGGKPTREQIQVLRGAVLQARQSARLASLDASAPGPDLTPDAQRILDFLENVVDTASPVDATLAALEQ